MPVRITSTSTKIGFVAASCVLFILGAALTIGLSLTSVSVVAGGLALILVGIAARTFRGEGEPVEQRRPWWKMTARPASGFVFAFLFGSQAIYVMTTILSGRDFAPSIVSCVINVFIGSMFAISSMRLRAADRAMTREIRRLGEAA